MGKQGILRGVTYGFIAFLLNYEVPNIYFMVTLNSEMSKKYQRLHRNRFLIRRRFEFYHCSIEQFIFFRYFSFDPNVVTDTNVLKYPLLGVQDLSEAPGIYFDKRDSCWYLLLKMSM